MDSGTSPAPETPPSAILGLDKDGRPRAVAYPTEMAEVAAKAAQAWKLRLGRAETDAALALTKDLPAGELFPSHKMEPPTISREKYNLLLKTVTTAEQPPISSKQPAAAASDSKPGC